MEGERKGLGNEATSSQILIAKERKMDQERKLRRNKQNKIKQENVGLTI